MGIGVGIGIGLEYGLELGLGFSTAVFSFRLFGATFFVSQNREEIQGIRSITDQNKKLTKKASNVEIQGTRRNTRDKKKKRRRETRRKTSQILGRKCTLFYYLQGGQY